MMGTDKNVCEYCEFFNIKECRRYPKQAYVQTYAHSAGNVRWQYPPVQPHDWCGEHKLKEYYKDYPESHIG